MKTQIEIETLAVRFRLNCPNLAHADTVECITSLGGYLPVLYGFWLAQRRFPREDRLRRNFIADQLDEIAKQLGRNSLSH